MLFLLSFLFYLLYGMPQYSLQLCRIRFARITEVDFVMFAANSHAITIAIFKRESTHPLHGGRFGGIRANMHHLDAGAFFEVFQPYLRERRRISLSLKYPFARFFEDGWGDHFWLHNHQ